MSACCAGAGRGRHSSSVDSRPVQPGPEDGQVTWRVCCAPLLLEPGIQQTAYSEWHACARAEHSGLQQQAALCGTEPQVLQTFRGTACSSQRSCVLGRRAVYVCGASPKASELFRKLDIIAAGPGRLSPASNRWAAVGPRAPSLPRVQASWPLRQVWSGMLALAALSTHHLHVTAVGCANACPCNQAAAVQVSEPAGMSASHPNTAARSTRLH